MKATQIVHRAFMLLIAMCVATFARPSEGRLVPGGSGPDLPDIRYSYDQLVKIANGPRPYFSGYVNGVRKTAVIVDGAEVAPNAKRIDAARDRANDGGYKRVVISQAAVVWMDHVIRRGKTIGHCWAVLPPGWVVYVQPDELNKRFYTDDLFNWKKIAWDAAVSDICGNGIEGIVYTKETTPAYVAPGETRTVYLWVDSPCPELQDCPPTPQPKQHRRVTSFSSKWRGEQLLKGQTSSYIPGASVWMTKNSDGSLSKCATPPTTCKPGEKPTIPNPPVVVVPPVTTPPNANQSPIPDPTVPNPGVQPGRPDGPGNGGTPITVPITRNGLMSFNSSAPPAYMVGSAQLHLQLGSFLSPKLSLNIIIIPS